MQSLTIDGIKDFQICERLYDYRHIEKISEKIYSRDIYTLKFESTIKNILYYFWFKKQAGITPSYASLLNRWEKLWFPKNMDHYDIITEQHESAYGNVSSLTTKAASILLNYYETYNNSSFIPISINDTYLAFINKKIKIQDKFDLIYIDNSINYVVKFLFNYRSNHRYIYQADFAAAYLGFKEKHPARLKQTKFGYIDLMSNSAKFIEYEITEEDTDSLEYWCDTIVEKEVFVPRRGLTSYCKKCPFDEPCSKWDGWK